MRHHREKNLINLTHYNLGLMTHSFVTNQKTGFLTQNEVYSIFRCDSYDDCGDNTDEINCPRKFLNVHPIKKTNVPPSLKQ